MVRTSNSCSSCRTVVEECAFVNKLTGPSVLLLQSSEIGSVCGLNSCSSSSWAIPVCRASALNTCTSSALVFNATPP